MMKKFTSLALFLILCSTGGATEKGVQLQDYEGFQKKWPLITVRFREDSGEMRFVWGNEKAMKGLGDGKGSYEEGSVFAKVSFKSDDDPSFTSSKVPSGARRAQLMIRDSVKYASTDGWGYFLFDSTGKPVKTDENACAACHRVVPERGLVFSQQVELENIFAKQTISLPLAIPESKVVFEDSGIDIVPANFRKYLPPDKAKKMRKLMQPWFRSAFEGTADEIRPLLTKEALRSAKAAIYVSSDQKVLSFVSQFKTGQQCAQGQASMRAVVAFVPMVAKSDTSEARIRELDYCANK